MGVITTTRPIVRYVKGSLVLGFGMFLGGYQALLRISPDADSAEKLIVPAFVAGCTSAVLMCQVRNDIFRGEVSEKLGNMKAEMNRKAAKTKDEKDKFPGYIPAIGLVIKDKFNGCLPRIGSNLIKYGLTAVAVAAVATATGYYIEQNIDDFVGSIMANPDGLSGSYAKVSETLGISFAAAYLAAKTTIRFHRGIVKSSKEQG